MATFIETFGNRANLGAALKVAANPSTDWDFVAFPGPAGMMLASDRVIFLADPEYFADSSPDAGELFKRAGSKLKTTGETLPNWEARAERANKLLESTSSSISALVWESNFYVDSPGRVDGFGRAFISSLNDSPAIAARQELVRLISATTDFGLDWEMNGDVLVARNRMVPQPFGAVKGWALESEPPD